MTNKKQWFFNTVVTVVANLLQITKIIFLVKVTFKIMKNSVGFKGKRMQFEKTNTKTLNETE